MKYTKLFEQFISESTDLQEEKKLTEHQLEVAMKLGEALDTALNNAEARTYQDSTIQISSQSNVSDWMDLTVGGEHIRMYLEQEIQMRPIFLSIEGNTEAEIKRMVDLGLIPNLSDFLEIDGEYITGFNVTSSYQYWSKDVAFEHTESEGLEFFSAEYLDINNNGPQELEEVAEQLGDTITDWLGEMYLTEYTLQEMLDKDFGSDEDDDDEDEDNEDENDEDENDD
jgi:hypothetical protein